jgi:DNA invertase Pin-like site-specific DNA recombinase
MEQTKVKVIIYARVSTSAQDTLRQEEILEKYCKDNNYEVVEKITEKISGTKSWEERELKEVFGNKVFDGVLVHELSRLGRNTQDVLTIISKLTAQKIWVQSYSNNNLRTLDENGRENTLAKMMLTILSGIAEHERNTILERSISGLNTSVRRGNWTGGKYLPYGYRRVEKKLEIDEEEAKVVKRIFKLHKSGNGTTRIAGILNQEKVPTRYNKSVEKSVKSGGLERDGASFKWASGTIYSILTNRVYIGEKEGTNSLKGLLLFSPPIIEKDEFEWTQLELKNNNSRTSTRFLYILHGKTKCGLCGRTYYPHKRISNKDNTYKCLSKRYGEKCDNYGIGIPRLNNAIWTCLRTNQQELENILNESKSKFGLREVVLELKQKIKYLELQIEEVKKREQKVIELYVSGSFDKATLDRTHNSIKNELAVFTTELSSLTSELTEKRLTLSKQNTASNLLKRIKDDAHVLKRTFERVITKVVIYPVTTNSIVGVFPNKQDKLVYVELFTFLNLESPIAFVISQRTNMILFVEREKVVYDKKTMDLSLFIKNQEEEEEEGEDLPVYRTMIEIETLSKTIYKQNPES